VDDEDAAAVDSEPTAEANAAALKPAVPTYQAGSDPGGYIAASRSAHCFSCPNTTAYGSRRS
jgi:hypothetical protein